MVTKYTTGDRVLVPMTITTAEIMDGKIHYSTEEFERLVNCNGQFVIAESKIEGYAKSEKKDASGGRRRESWWRKWLRKTAWGIRSRPALLFCLIASLTDAKR